MGGKRVCLGKTFAEVVIRYTIPILFHHFDFQFVSPEQASFKEPYAVGGQKELSVPVRLTIRNKA